MFTQYMFNIVIALVLLSLLNRPFSGINFGILTIFALGQLIFAIKYMKETNGKSLEEIKNILETDNSIKNKRNLIATKRLLIESFRLIK
jgi:hypothetical protein